MLCYIGKIIIWAKSKMLTFFVQSVTISNTTWTLVFVYILFSTYWFCLFINLMCYIMLYHIFCCNMLIFACPIIAKSQCWLFVLGANTGQISVFSINIRICPLISVFALIYPYLPPYSTSGICAVVSKIICQSTRKDDA